MEIDLLCKLQYCQQFCYIHRNTTCMETFSVLDLLFKNLSLLPSSNIYEIKELDVVVICLSITH